MTTITIGLVTYNRAHLLENAINSVLRQTFRDFILIISDDNSTDGTEEVARKYLTKDPRIQYCKRPGIGMTENFTQTLNDATTEYFMWLCDDDAIGDNYLEECLQFLNSHQEYVMACGITRFMLNGKIQDRKEFIDVENGEGSQRVLNYYQDVNSNIVLYGLMRRKVIEQFDYPDTFGADLLWSSQVVFSGKVKILDTTSFYYSLEGISQQTTNLKEYYKTTKKVRRNPYEILRNRAYQLIMNQDVPFGALPYYRRFMLACKVWIILRERFCMPAYEARIRSSIKLRTRIKALFR